MHEKPSIPAEFILRQRPDCRRRAKVAIHRLRRRFRELVKGEIARTVGDAAQVQEELLYLVEVLAAT